MSLIEWIVFVFVILLLACLALGAWLTKREEKKKE